MPQNPAFTLTGDSNFSDTSVSFEVAFENVSDQPLAQAYEWYIDSILVTNATGQSLNAHVNCGSHIVSVRVLYQDLWTGTQDLSFKTCHAIVLTSISGPNEVDLGYSVTYAVIQEYSDGTSEDVTNQYIFSSSAGGSFSGNVFTATVGDSPTPPFSVTITASSGEETPLTKDITINAVDVTSMGILVVDLYNNSTLNVIGLIDNAEVEESHQPAYTGNNFIPAESAAADALVLASDFIDQSILNWRYEFNLHKLKLQYPATDQFRLFIIGRGATKTTLNGAYVVFNPQGTMIMANSPGTYIPSVSGGIQVVSQTSFTASVLAGANGSYNEDVLTTIIEFIYTVSNNSVAYATSID